MGMLHAQIGDHQVKQYRVEQMEYAKYIML